MTHFPMSRPVKTDRGLRIADCGFARPAIRAALCAFCLLHFALGFAYQPRDMSAGEVFTHPEALQHYKENPARFIFKTPEDLPKDLKWETGENEPEFASPEAVRGGTVTISIGGYPPTLRRHGPNSNHGYRGYIYDNGLMALVGFHPITGAHIPELAKAWAISPDRRTVYFRLREDARFNDGQPITAADFLFTFFRAQCPHLNDLWSADYYGKEFESITRYDDYTLAVTLPSPKPDPLVFAALSPTPRHFYRELGPDFVSRYQRRFEPVPGPYVLLPGDDRTEQSVTLTRVERWWGDSHRYLRNRYNPEKIVLKVVRETEKSVQIFLSGQQDLMMIQGPKYWYGLNDKEPVKKGWIAKSVFYNDFPRPPYGFYLNTAKPPLDNLDVRVGLHHATDWQRVINTYYRADYDRLNQYAQGYGKYTDTSIKARPFDPDRAMAHFAKAGFTKRGPDGILVNAEGRRLSFKLLIDDGDRKKMLPAFIDSARKAGVEFVPRALERTTMYKEVMEKNHEIVFWAWGTGGLWPDFRQGFHDENAVDAAGKIRRQTNNITLLRDPQMSAMIDRFRDLTDEEEMVKLSKAMQRRLHDKAVFIPGFCIPGYRLASWRWVRFPENFDAKRSDDPFVFGLFWIDPKIKEETEAAMKSGRSFGPSTRVYDTYRAD